MMSRQDLYQFLKDDILRFGDLPPMKIIKRKYQIDDESIIRKVIGNLKAQNLLVKDYKLAYDYN
jgi:hypothetical protein